jgi:hypothetical protein
MSFQDYWQSERCRDLRRQLYQGDIDGSEANLTYRVEGAEKERLLAAINEGATEFAHKESCKLAFKRRQKGEYLTEREKELAGEWEVKYERR